MLALVNYVGLSMYCNIYLPGLIEGFAFLFFRRIIIFKISRLFYISYEHSRPKCYAFRTLLYRLMDYVRIISIFRSQIIRPRNRDHCYVVRTSYVMKFSNFI